MFDYHIHSRVSFDGHNTGLEMALAAKAAGLREICFTDHIDYDPFAAEQIMVFDNDVYAAAYDNLEVPGLAIRRGMEFGLEPDNQAQFRLDAARRDFDFILGSIHFVDGLDVYFEPYWKHKTQYQAEHHFLEQTLACVQAHDGFDVLAHLSFISKSPVNPAKALLKYEDHRDIIDEILRELVRKDKGLEMNTSGVDRCGGYLPTADVFRRFHELGGRIVTVGSDAHQAHRVGQYTFDACEILKDIFGYVCTFENRKPIFHKL